MSWPCLYHSTVEPSHNDYQKTNFSAGIFFTHPPGNRKKPLRPPCHQSPLLGTNQKLRFAEQVWNTCMMVTIVFFLLIAVFVGTAIRAARESAISPSSQPGTVVEAEDGSGAHMNLGAHICSCDDWQRNRSRFVRGTPMRLCKHLTAYYAKRLDALPPSLQSKSRLVALMSIEGQGMPCGVGTEYGHLDELAYVIYVVDSTEPKARLILGGRRYDLNLTDDTWLPGPPLRAGYFSVRARQLANAAFSK